MPRAATAKSRNVKSDLARQVIDPDRPKDFLTPAEVEKLLRATRTNRHHFRDHALIRLIYRHGMRVSEAINLRRTDADLQQHRLTFKRLKHGFSVPHPIDGESVRAFKRYLATRTDTAPWLFLSERRSKLTRQAVNYLLLETRPSRRPRPRPSPHAAPRLRLRPCRQGHGFSRHAGLSRPQKPAPHRALLTHQPSAVQQSVGLGPELTRKTLRSMRYQT